MNGEYKIRSLCLWPYIFKVTSNLLLSFGFEVMHLKFSVDDIGQYLKLSLEDHDIMIRIHLVVVVVVWEED